MKKIMGISIMLSIALSSTSYAQTVTTEELNFTPAKLSLQAQWEEQAVRLNWETNEGEAPKGYKIVWSVYTEPQFPIRESDYFDTVSLPTTKTALIDYFLNEGAYYARVCVYDGTQQCLTYSNQIKFSVEKIAGETAEEFKFVVKELIEDGIGTGNEPPENEEKTETQPPTEELPVTQEPVSLSDIENHHNEEAITYLFSQKIIAGYPDGTFKPDNKINRAELTKIIAEATLDRFDIENCLINLSADNIFSDVNKDQWYSKYICAAKKAGYINGYPDGTFKPGQEISFVETSKIITLGFWEKIEEGDIWYEPFVNYLSVMHAIPETIKSFNYHISRAEMAEIIYRLKNKIIDKPFHTYEKLAISAE
jgi:hypothetical protein